MGTRSTVLFWTRTIVLTVVSVVHARAQGPPGAHASSSLDSLLKSKVTSVSKYEQTLEEAPAAVSILTADDIGLYGFRTLGEALATVRGFYLSYDRTYTYLGVRGLARPSDYNDRVLLLLDGHVMNEDVFGSALLGTESGISLSSVDRIEIVRGSLSSRYGTGALLASINIVTKKARIIDGAKLSAEGGSFDSYHGSFLYGKEFENGLSLVGTAQGGWIGGPDLYFREFDDPSTMNGITRNNDGDLYRSCSLDARYASFGLRAFLSQRDKHVPTAYYGSLFGDSRTTVMDRRGFLEARYDHALSAELHLALRGSYDVYDYGGTYPYADMVEQDAATGRRLGGELQLLWDTSERNRLILETQYTDHLRNTYRYWYDQSPPFLVTEPFGQFSLSLTDQLAPARDLSLEFSLRYDDFSFRGSEDNHTTGAVTPRGALVYRPAEGTTCKVMYGEAFRIPNLFEREYEEPSQRFKENNALHEEWIRTGELLVSQRIGPRLLGTLSFFHYDLRGLIDQVVDPVDSMQEYQNLSRALSYGVETELEMHLENGAQGYARYMYQSTHSPSGERLTNSPRSVNFASIDFSEYLGSLIRELAHLYGRPGIQCSVHSEEALFGVDAAIPLGLILNELVTNALKHAFVGRDQGSVIVSMQSLENEDLEISVRDDGVGFPEQVDSQDTSTLGMQLVTSLVLQLEGTLQLARGAGTEFVIRLHARPLGIVTRPASQGSAA